MIQLSDITSGDKIIYLDIPVHLNIGDLLIYLGTEMFFKKTNVDVLYRASVHDCSFDYIDKLLKKHRDVKLVLHGGGNWGDIYRLHQEFRNSIISKYLDVSIIILPQSIYYSSNKYIEKDLSIITAHGNVSIYVRDYESNDFLASHNLQGILFPDMAYYLKGSLKYNQLNSSGKTLVLQRRDVEALSRNNNLKCDSFDWLDIITIDIKILFKIFRIFTLMPSVTGSVKYKLCYHTFSKLLVSRAISKFCSYEIIVTDRLHGAILSDLLNLKNKFNDNVYGKINRHYTLLGDLGVTYRTNCL